MVKDELICTFTVSAIFGFFIKLQVKQVNVICQKRADKLFVEVSSKTAACLEHVLSLWLESFPVRLEAMQADLVDHFEGDMFLAFDRELELYNFCIPVTQVLLRHRCELAQ